MSGQPAVLQVVIMRDGLLVGTEVLVPGSYTVGSGDDVDLRLDDETVEPHHAVLYFQNGKVAIQDAGSRGGVWVNGHKVTTCEVRSVDEISVGPFSIKVRTVANKQQQKAPPPEVAALLRGNPTAAPKGTSKGPPPVPPSPRAPSGTTGTVLSARRMANAPRDDTEVASPRGGAVHLRALTPLPDVQLHEVDPQATEAVEMPEELRAPPPRPRAKAKARAPEPEGPRSRRSAPLPGRARLDAKDKTGRSPKLFFELYWGDVRRDARSFGHIKQKKPLVGGAYESAPMPLWGFSLGEGPFVLAEESGDGYRVYVPKKAAVETRKGDAFYPATPDQLEKVGSRRCVTLRDGMGVRFSEGEMSLVAYVQLPLKQPFANPLAGLPWMVLFLLAVFGSGLGAFMAFAPKTPENPDFDKSNLPPVAVRLIAPPEQQKKKAEEAKKKLEEIKSKEPKPKKKEPPVVAKSAPKEKVAPAPETKALKALSKLTAAGPAMGDMLAAVDKLGNGPGSKFVKDSNYKLSGLIGKAPIANAGLGTFGLGGGGGGGFGTKGMEILRGKGGGGIGALGAGGVGKGTVGGTVARASARSVAVQGSIDREAVAKVVNSHLQEVRACYERALLKDPGLAGKVVLEWTISTQGRVVTAKTKSSTLRNSAVEGCILGNLKTWIFPSPKGGIVIVSYPFMFNSVGY